MVVKRGCNPFGRGERGLITSNKVAHRRLRRNEHASVVLWTPPGTRIFRVDWSGKLRRSDCGFTVELYAVRPGARPAYIKRERAGRHCPTATTANASYAPPRHYNTGAATALVQRVICRSKHGCSAARLTMLATRYAKAYVADFTSPSLRIVGGGLASGRWVRGEQSIRFTATDNVGIRTSHLLVDGHPVSKATAPCNYARRMPCPSGVSTLATPTERAARDGIHSVEVEVADASGNPRHATTRALIDNSPPDRITAAVEGGEAWRRSNIFAVRWSNPIERYAPIIAAFGRLCPTITGACREARYGGAGISRIAPLKVPGPGVWKFAVWRQDAAGNADRGRASVPVTLRYDPEPPRLVFERQVVADPTRVSVLVTDKVSGLARGEIELRRRGTTSWESLATAREGSRLVAHVDDSRLPAGTYDLRSRAFDQAGNEASTGSRYDGSPMVLRLPIRFESFLTAGVAIRRTIRRRVVRHGHRRVVKRHVVKLVPAARLSLGRRVRISGRLTNADGQPIPGATIYVYSRSVLAPEALAGIAVSDPNGRFRYVARGSTTRALRFVYVGTRLALPSSRQVTLRVLAASTLRASRRRATNGQSVTFRGRVRSLPIPPSGKLVELQAHFRGRWRTFSTVRSDSRGRWRFKYRFGGTVGRVRYRFRALLPAEGGYPFETGRSRVVKVTVRGP
ncbi:MAG: hypothetical protein ACJ766_16040 [Thermoleophilaceae bacterium]